MLVVISTAFSMLDWPGFPGRGDRRFVSSIVLAVVVRAGAAVAPNRSWCDARRAHRPNHCRRFKKRDAAPAPPYPLPRAQTERRFLPSQPTIILHRERLKI